MTDRRPDDAGTRHGWLLLRRRGTTWGVAHSTLCELTGRCLELESGEKLMADELLNLAVGLTPHPFPDCLRGYYSERIHGLAVWHGRPVVLLEPGAAPPECLRAPNETQPVQPETSTMDVDGDEIR